MFYNNYKELFLQENKNPFENQINKLQGLKIKNFQLPKSTNSIYKSYNINEIFNNKYKPDNNFISNRKLKNSKIINNKYNKHINKKHLKQPNYFENNIFKSNDNILNYNKKKLEKNSFNDNYNFLNFNKKKRVFNNIKENNNIYKFENKNENFKKLESNKSKNKKNDITYNFLKDIKNSKVSLEIKSEKNRSKNIKDIFDSMSIYTIKNSTKNNLNSKIKNLNINLPKNIKNKMIKELISKIIPDDWFNKLLVEKSDYYSNLIKLINKRIENKINNKDKKTRLKKILFNK